MTSNRPAHRSPAQCPVCSARLVTNRLGCGECGTELSGEFAPCSYCGLPDDDLTLLRVFLTSRGNMKDLERHLGVSYPTARQRFADVLGRLGFEEVAPRVDREQVLSDLAAGRLGLDEAEAQLRADGAG